MVEFFNIQCFEPFKVISRWLGRQLSVGQLSISNWIECLKKQKSAKRFEIIVVTKYTLLSFFNSDSNILTLKRN